MLYLVSCSQIPQVSNTRFMMNEPMGFVVLMLFKCLKRSFSKSQQKLSIIPGWLSNDMMVQADLLHISVKKKKSPGKERK